VAPASRSWRIDWLARSAQDLLNTLAAITKPGFDLS
jgi:hypothetical protein